MPTATKKINKDLGDLEERFEDLKDQSLDLAAMPSAVYENFKRELEHLEQDLENLKEEIEKRKEKHPEDKETLDQSLEATEVMFIRLKVPQGRLAAQEHKKSVRGKLGLKNPFKKDDSKTEVIKAHIAKSNAPTYADRVSEAMAKIKEERLLEDHNDFSDQTLDLDDPDVNRSQIILTNAVSAFRNALIPPLLASDKTELMRRQEALDAMQASQRVDPLSGTPFEIARGVADHLKNVMAKTSKVLLEVVEEGTGNIFKAVGLFLGWPLILPIKVLNQGFTAAKYAACFADGVLGFFDKGLDQLLTIGLRPIEFENEGKKLGSLVLTRANIARAAVHLLVRGPLILGRGFCQSFSIAARFLERNIDADRWMKSKPVIAGFSIGGVGVIVLVALTLASIPGLGIPLAVAAGALALATAGAALQGYFKGKKLKEELNSGKLNEEDANALSKHNHEHSKKHKASKTAGHKLVHHETVSSHVAEEFSKVHQEHHKHHAKHSHHAHESSDENDVHLNSHVAREIHEEEHSKKHKPKVIEEVSEAQQTEREKLKKD